MGLNNSSSITCTVEVDSDAIEADAVEADADAVEADAIEADAIEADAVEADTDEVNAIDPMHKTIKNEIAVCFYILAKNSSVSTHTVQNQYLWQVVNAG